MNIEDECVICLEPLQDYKLTKLRCNHIIHKECINKFINSNCKLNDKCPICRAPITFYSNNKTTLNVIKHIFMFGIQIVLIYIPIIYILDMYKN